MDQETLIALEQPPDYSDAFTDRMAELREIVHNSIGGPVDLDPDMNYSASQKLAVFMDGRWRRCKKNAEASALELAFLISSKGPLFTCVCRRKTGANEWARVPCDEIGDQASAILQRAKTELEQQGLTELSERAVAEMAVGHRTELDGVPATVFQVLFSELV